ncbi:MAG: hypothetical protein KFF77_06450, partial [Bacteroidetes bacterium]|nr:hypothetical protein [Bacteroidota bacterium]
MKATVVLVGAGRVGLNLMRHLRRMHIPLYCIVERDPDRRMQASGAFPGAILAPDLPAPWPSGITHCILAVPDGQISRVAHALASEPSLPAGLVV